MARTLIGTVSSAKRDKTITVTVASRETHPLYRKQFTFTRKYSAHDEKNEASEGDKVLIAETRPVSKTVNWKLEKILEKSHGKLTLKEDTTEMVEDKRDYSSKSKSSSEEEMISQVSESGTDKSVQPSDAEKAASSSEGGRR